MSQRPSTPVKVPSSAADYTPATLDPDLRSQINTILLRDGHVPKSVPPPSPLSPFPFPLTNPPPPSRRIQERLLHALNADASNWPTMVQNHALHLLRSGEVLTFPALLRRVLDDIHEATNKAAAAATTTTNGSSSSKAAAAATNGTDGTTLLALAVPQAVVDETMRVTKECLETVCEIED
ncbi:hypothetical protein CCM_00970 [Cordyceps militaris CM01]|uniref:Uncharacterized protein n=1 Tax=Cordyceps militaris (strain CM01) TaxID=983644 RepID=G3J7E4_CORMM|nr:uncharacterized protein CCM_00970 [Cordyceps militaris CM01]EGX96314.1 hypothetical protein CCM_00970 [Cordyceps militaris CM01]